MKTNIVRSRILALLGLSGLAGGAFAQPAGTFVATGIMNVSRSQYTATRLRDGRILIAGGIINGGKGAPPYLDSAEIYDPSTGTFTPTGSMKDARYGHTAALLADGRVLIAGGWGNTAACVAFPDQCFMLTSAEIYDPFKGTFEFTGDLKAEYDPLITSVPLKDGRVLIVGGGWTTESPEIYDPSTGQFTSLGPIPLVWPSATLLADGRVLLVGNTSGWSDNIALIYDPAAGTFNPTGSQIPYSIFANQASAPTTGFGVALLADGNVLLVGGRQGEGGPSRTAAEIYDPSTGAFRQTGNGPAVNGPTATTLHDGQVLVGAGKTAALYDPGTGAFRSLSLSPIGSWGSTATLLLDGTVLIAEAGSTQTEVWLYVPAPSIGVDRTSLSFAAVAGQSATQTIGMSNAGGGTLQWNVTTTAPWLSATPSGGTNSGTVSVTASAAGLSAGTYSASVKILADAANAPVVIPVTFVVSPAPPAQTPGPFTPTGQMSDSRNSHTATLLADGKVLITGGYGPKNVVLASAEIYDPASGTFTRTGNMTTSREGHGATLLPDGRVLILGGSDGKTTLDSAELYDPSRGAFTATGKMVASGFGSGAATLLRDGKVVVVGTARISAFDIATLTQIFDPETNAFTAAGPQLGSGDPVALADGRVLIASTFRNQLYDPASGAVTSASNVPADVDGIYDYTSTLLINSKVLFAGGQLDIFCGSLDVSDTAWLFDPQAGTFATTGSLREARYQHTATLMGDGSVLVAGGVDSRGKTTSSVELYDFSTGTFAAAGQMTGARIYHTATLLKDGRVLITGGSGTVGQLPLSSAELYVPAWWSSAPGIGVDQVSLSLAAPPGQQATQAVAVTNTGGGDLQWNVISTTPWLNATPASDTNSGTVNITASAAGLPEGTYRANITILGSAANSPLIIPVTFAVAPCSYAANPGGQAFSAAGGTGTISISVGGGCHWTISSSLNWVTFGGATSGTGNATVSFQVAPNSSAARLGTLSIAGMTFSQAFSVEQQSALTTGLGFAGSIAHIAAAGDWNSTITLVNTGASAANARLSFFDDNGNPLALPLAFPQDPTAGGPLLAATLDRTLAPNATLVIDTAGRKTDPVQAGSVQLSTDGNVTAFNLYRWNFNNQEASAPLEIRNASAWVLPFDNTNGLLNGGAIANLTAQALTIPVVIRDDTGAVIRSSSISLAGEGHTSFLVNALFTDTANKRGTIEFDTPAGGRTSVAGLRFTPSGALTTIPVQGDAASGSSSFAQIAAGADWNTTITLINTGAGAAHAHLSFFDDNGSPLALRFAFPQEPSSFPFLAANLDRTLAPNAALVIDTAGLKTDPVQGGSVRLSTDGNVGALSLYQWSFNNQEAMAPLEIRNADAYVLPFDNTNGLTNGGAIANLSAQPVIIPVLIRDDTGALIGSFSISLASEGHTSFGLSTLFADTANKRGTIEFVAPAGGGISVTGLRFTPSGTFTTIPVIAK